MPAKQVLVADNVSNIALWSNNPFQTTHTPPSKNIPISWIFRLVETCKCQSWGIGKSSIKKSETTLSAAPTTRTLERSMQWPLTVGSQAAWTGTHWKIAEKIWVIWIAATNAPTIHRIRWKHSPGNMRLYKMRIEHLQLKKAKPKMVPADRSA